jgi:hypothetical protein
MQRLFSSPIMICPNILVILVALLICIRCISNPLLNKLINTPFAMGRQCPLENGPRDFNTISSYCQKLFYILFKYLEQDSYWARNNLYAIPLKNFENEQKVQRFFILFMPVQINDHIIS